MIQRNFYIGFDLQYNIPVCTTWNSKRP